MPIQFHITISRIFTFYCAEQPNIGCPINYNNYRGNSPSSPLVNGTIGAVSKLSGSGIPESLLPVIRLIGQLIGGRSLFAAGYGKEVVLPVQSGFPILTDA